MALSYSEKDIVRESGGLFMIHVKPGVYEIYLSGITHAIRRAWVSFKNDDAAARIKADLIFDKLSQQTS